MQGNTENIMNSIGAMAEMTALDFLSNASN